MPLGPRLSVGPYGYSVRIGFAEISIGLAVAAEQQSFVPFNGRLVAIGSSPQCH